MDDPTLNFGLLHSKLGQELSTGMKKLRAQILTHVECLGLEPGQEGAFKSLVKNATSDFWTNFENILGKEFEKATQNTPTQGKVENI